MQEGLCKRPVSFARFVCADLIKATLSRTTSMEETEISTVTASLGSQDLTSAMHDTRLQERAVRLGTSVLLSGIHGQWEQERARDREELAALFAGQLQEAEKASVQRRMELRSEMEGMWEKAVEEAEREQEMRDVLLIERLEEAERDQEMRDAVMMKRLETARMEQEMRDVLLIKRLEEAERDQEMRRLEWEHKSAKAYNELRAEHEKFKLDFKQFKTDHEQLKATVHRQVEHMAMLSEHRKSKVRCWQLLTSLDPVVTILSNALVGFRLQRPSIVCACET